MSQINATDFIKRLDNGETLNLLDVREETEYLTYNIGGHNMPLSQLPASLDKVSHNKNEEFIVICTKGLRSETARVILNQNGYTNVRNLTGGLIALQKINNKTF
jgi:adenylyltransferase/sulfurtransferase